MSSLGNGRNREFLKSGRIWVTSSSSYTPCKSRKCLKRSTNLPPIHSEKLLSSLAFNQAILIHIIWVRSVCKT
ncbi:hypothetical protein [Wolbachia endosymbiont (group A) of Pogonocherus hispidulus]|uniref:hypothetical protein n=1 Tax=Wolbachia endosymbiont (group A) of Pogonocherus hispidulus TaxID=3066136 RepID=UPI0033408AB4